MKHAVLLGLARLLQKLSVPGVRRLARFTGAAMWLLLSSRRKATIRRIAERLDVAEEQARSIARASFGHTAQSFLDILIAGKLGSPELPLIEGWQSAMERIENTRRPIMLFTAHFGPWEIGATFIGRSRQHDVLCVVRKQKDEAANQVIRLLRRENGLNTVDHRDVTGVVMEHLRKNGIVCFLADHNTPRKEALFIPFLGETAAVTMGPALLAVRAKAIVQGCFIRREPDGSNSSFFLEPLDTALLQGSVKEKIRFVAEFYTAAIEEQIRSCPEQWFWIHNRWKTRPVAESQTLPSA